MTPNPLTTLTAALEAALAAGDGAAVSALLDANPPLWEVREGHGAEWDRYAEVLLHLAERNLEGTGPQVRHALRNLLWTQDHATPEAGCRRLAQVLPAIDRWVAGDELELLRFVDEIRGPRGRCGAVDAWLGRIRRRELHPHVSPDVAEAAWLAYTCSPRWEDVPGPNWADLWPDLVARLTGPDGQVRFYAAHLLGEWYVDHPDLQPGLRLVFDRITTLDLARPGVAGPFLSAFYSSMGLDTLQGGTGVDVREWVLHLLKHRRGPEPWTLPCCNNIDFYAHELLESEEDLVRLIRAGHLEIAAESALDSGIDFRAVLRGLTNEPLPVARDIAAYLLVQDGELPQGAEAAGAVRRLAPLRGTQRLLLEPTARDPEQPTLLVVLPAAGEDRLSDEAAWAVLDAAFPPALRGELTADIRTLQRGGTRTITYAHGTTVHLIGSGPEAGWQWVVLASDLPFTLWAAR